MAIKALYRAQAFGPGSDMWVVPTHEVSSLVQKMDWYLNFQLAKAHNHKPQGAAPQLLSLLNENQLEILAQSPKHSGALMVPAEHTFPTKTVVQTPNENKKNWVQCIHNLWQDMGQPSLRVFLPATIEVDEFKSQWPGPSHHEVTVVPY